MNQPATTHCLVNCDEVEQKNHQLTKDEAYVKVLGCCESSCGLGVAVFTSDSRQNSNYSKQTTLNPAMLSVFFSDIYLLIILITDDQK